MTSSIREITESPFSAHGRTGGSGERMNLVDGSGIGNSLWSGVDSSQGSAGTRSMKRRVVAFGPGVSGLIWSL